jgi:hypothetical protein
MTYSILAPASRPVVDVGPLPDDHHEPMSERGITVNELIMTTNP